MVDWLISQPSWSRRAWLDALDADALSLIAGDWNGWANAAQRPPEGDWATWLLMGGRGAGKTRAGAEWVYRQAQSGRRLALIGPTLHAVREVMIEGPSGLTAIASAGARPHYHAGRRLLEWPNGAEAHVFSATDPDSLRGPQFHHAWADEFCAWPHPDDTLAMLRLGLRLGRRPRLTVTTSPRPIGALRRLIAETTTTTSRAATMTNDRNLAPGFREALQDRYGGTRTAAQELDGQLLEADGGLWTHALLTGCRGGAPDAYDLVVIGLDPPATAGGDACGIVVAGRRDGRAYVIADETAQGRSPMGWASRVVTLTGLHGADWVVAEVNQGGDMVGQMLKMAGCTARVRSVHASESKRGRAEPVAALYEQGKVVHCGDFAALEEELMSIGDPGRRGSPDRADALVWAIHELMLRRREASPGIRGL